MCQNWSVKYAVVCCQLENANVSFFESESLWWFECVQIRHRILPKPATWWPIVIYSFTVVQVSAFLSFSAHLVSVHQLPIFCSANHMKFPNFWRAVSLLSFPVGTYLHPTPSARIPFPDVLKLPAAWAHANPNTPALKIVFLEDLSDGGWWTIIHQLTRLFFLSIINILSSMLKGASMNQMTPEIQVVYSHIWL